jgi:hypothetical protein
MEAGIFAPAEYTPFGFKLNHHTAIGDNTGIDTGM